MVRENSGKHSALDDLGLLVRAASKPLMRVAMFMVLGIPVAGTLHSNGVFSTAVYEIWLVVFSLLLLLLCLWEYSVYRDRFAARHREKYPWKYDHYGQLKRD